MAALNFPSSPTLNQIHTENGKSWRWDGTSWLATNAIGYTGSLGYTGSVGNTGYTGSVGNTGSTGATGYTGSVGFVGSIGNTGYTGSVASVDRTIGITIDGGGSTITTGIKGYIVAGFSGTINAWDVVGNTSGSIVIDIWKATAGNIPTIANTIAGSEKPTLSAQQINSDTNLTTWTVSITKGDVIGFNVDSVSTLTKVTCTLRITT